MRGRVWLLPGMLPDAMAKCKSVVMDEFEVVVGEEEAGERGREMVPAACRVSRLASSVLCWRRERGRRIC